jgi:DNA processing protein
VSDAKSRSSSPDERRAILALTLVAEVGSVTHRQLNERFRSAMRALDEGFSKTTRAAAYASADRLLDAGAQRGLALVTIADDLYPSQLRDLHDPPPVLWSRGEWSALRHPIVAMVGTRRATSYGRRVTQEIATALSRGGASIVSGMALGIDAIAHTAALATVGETIAVLGTGADVAYPRAHTALHREIGARGLVLSEMSPGAHSEKGSFPRRNRIIAGLAQLTIVVEAPVRSGALITSRCALDLGRDVAAVPGPIDSPQSFGANELIREGAHAITSVAEALRLVGLDPPARSAPQLNGESEVRIWAALENVAASLDDLCGRVALPVAQCLTTVTALEMRGVIECSMTGEVRRRA